MYAREVGGQPTVPSITTVIGMEKVDLTGWAGYLAAKTLSEDARLPLATGDPSTMRRLVRDSASAAESHRDLAAARGDRVHNYAEQYALREMGKPHELDAALAALLENGELGFVRHFETWWRDFKVEPIAAEVTVWNQSVGYAGTIDLVARVGGQVCLVDYKTRGTDREGQVKSPDPKVIMQLAAAAKAEEHSIDPVAGTWEPWPFDTDVMLLAVALGEVGARTFTARPSSMPAYWSKFWALHRTWQAQYQLLQQPSGLIEIGPPPQPGAARPVD